MALYQRSVLDKYLKQQGGEPSDRYASASDGLTEEEVRVVEGK